MPQGTSQGLPGHLSPSGKGPSGKGSGAEKEVAGEEEGFILWGLHVGRSLMGLLQGPAAGIEKRGHRVSWASEFGGAEAAEGPLLEGRLC